MTHVAVLVPGIMGSELRLGEELIWPGPVSSLVGRYKKMAKLLRDDLVATDVIRSYLVSRQYGSLIEDLGTCGFRENADPATLVTCPYDWRKSNRLAAATLAAAIDRAVSPFAGEIELSIVAHSMGGLVARYYLESGEFAERPGFASVRRLITLATPHRGSPLALTAALGQERRLFLNNDQVLQIASDPRYPALYELLPPHGEPFAWNEGKGAEYRGLDVYSVEIAGALGLVRDNLDAAAEFHSKLDLVKRPQAVRYFYFVGTRQQTISAVRLLWTGEGYRVRRLEAEDGGDGTVPAWSAAIGGIQGQPVGGEHGTIYRNDDLRRTLATLLGKDGVLAAAAQRVEVAARERVVEPEDEVHVSLAFAGGVSHVDGQLRIERARVDDEGNLVEFAPTRVVRDIRYSGLTAESLGVILDAPAMTGIYRIAYYPTGAPEPAGSDELFVQEPGSGSVTD